MPATIVAPQTWRDKLGQARKLYEDAKAIVENGQATAEDKGKIPAMVEDAKRLQSEAYTLKAIYTEGLEVIARDTAELAASDEAKSVGGSHKPGGFKTWGSYLYEVWKAGNPAVKDAVHPNLFFLSDDDHKNPSPVASKDMSGASGGAGGFLIPAEFNATLMAALGERGIVRSRATVIPMRRRQLDIPVLDQTTTTAGRPHWFGGLQFYWQEEASAKTSSDATFRQQTLVARKLVGFTRASDELLDDSAISLEAFLTGPLGFSGGAAWMEDYAFLRGTGAGTPLGVINAPATITVTRNTASTVKFADFANMLENFLPSGRGVWMISQSLMSEIIQLEGPDGNASYVWQPNARDGIPGTLLGYPVIWTEKLPRKGYSGDVLLADWNYYLVGDRQATVIESTKFEKWQYDQTSWRMVHRVDGQPWLSAPLTYEDGETQVSPFVILSGTASS